MRRSDAAFELLKREWGQIDIVVHAVAFAPREALDRDLPRGHDAARASASRTMSPATASPPSPAAHAPLMAGRRGALLTLSYLGAVRSIPGYNVMGLAKASLEANVRFLAADLGPQGIRVNGISAGPIKTLAAAGIPRLSQDAESRGGDRAAAAQRDTGGRRQCRRLPVLGPRRRDHRARSSTSTAGFSTVGMSFPLEAEG